jgi:hypothetical protein
MDSIMEPLETLPENLLEEIKTYYPNVSYERYGHPITPTTVSRRTNREIVETGLTVTFTDMESPTYEQIERNDAILVRSYILRFDFCPDKDYLHAVLKMEAYTTPEIINWKG